MSEHIESSNTIPFRDHHINLFWSKVLKQPGGGCWTWTGNLSPRGYGNFKPGSSHINIKVWRAHRFAWRITFGEIPDGMLICHHCDNPTCVNPSHLFLGTSKDNAKDRESKGRGARPGNYRRTVSRLGKLATLTLEQVESIRDLYHGRGKGMSQFKLAKQFGVCQQSISNIIHRKTWYKILALPADQRLTNQAQ